MAKTQTLPAKRVSDSKTVMTELIMPNDTNPMGNLMGGYLMRWMDIASAICAGKHCEAHVVTAAVDHISFQNPIGLGDVITLEASVTRAFSTSVEVFVEVFANNMKGQQPRRCNHAYFTFVALDDKSAAAVERRRKPVRKCHAPPRNAPNFGWPDQTQRRQRNPEVFYGFGVMPLTVRAVVITSFQYFVLKKTHNASFLSPRHGF